MLKIYKVATSILLKLLTLKLAISRTIWRIEVSDSSFFFRSFDAFSFEVNFFQPEFPFKLNRVSYGTVTVTKLLKVGITLCMKSPSFLNHLLFFLCACTSLCGIYDPLLLPETLSLLSSLSITLPHPPCSILAISLTPHHPTHS